MLGNQGRGFTLLETAAVMVVVSLLVGVTMPAVQRARTDMRGAQSAANLAFIGQGTAMYAADHEGRLFNYTWSGPPAASGGVLKGTIAFFLMPDGAWRPANSDQEAASWQNTEILMRRTGRIDGPDRFWNIGSRLAPRRYSHLVLMDYLDLPFPSEVFADPADANLLQWQANPTDATVDNNIPYAPGSDIKGYDHPGGWNEIGVRQRWAYSSSYLRTVTAWTADGLDGRPHSIPVSETPHLTASSGGGGVIHARFTNEVVFPSAKVHYFEEFDRRQAGSPYFAYDHAAPSKLMFDGSINDRPSGEANPSWNPADGKQEWRQTYVPIHTFPVPLGGLGDQTLLSQRYRWTLGGLRGIDYAAPLMRR